MSRPSVVVAVVPHVYATALANALRRADRFDVHVPDIIDGEEPVPMGAAVMVTNLPVGRHAADVVIGLPETERSAITVHAGDIALTVPVVGVSYVAVIVGLVDRYAGTEDVAAERI